MRPTWIAALAVAIFMSGAARAGIYSTLDKPLGMKPTTNGTPLPLNSLLIDVNDLRSVRIADPSKQSELRKEYLKLQKELDGKVFAGSATLEDKINLSACLIRLGEPDKAVQLLRPILTTEQGQRNFMVLANLGTAYQLTGDPVAALTHLSLANAMLPQAPGFTKEQRAWFAEVEKTRRELLKARLREAPPGSGPAKPIETVDDLFKVRFVGDSGQFEAGKLTEEERKKLPKDAVAIVQQLLLWMPDDSRLYWLLGELLNAEGNLRGAEQVLDECADSRGLNAAELRQHRQTLKEALKPPPPEEPNFRPLLVGGGIAGMVILGLVIWQVRELRRRRAERKSVARS